MGRGEEEINEGEMFDVLREARSEHYDVIFLYLEIYYKS